MSTGENDDAEGIWQAVFKLNALRLGHALHLGQAPDLLQAVADRAVAIEMCPYANVHIGPTAERRWPPPTDGDVRKASFAPPGLGIIGRPEPTADAVGYRLPVLRTSKPPVPRPLFFESSRLLANSPGYSPGRPGFGTLLCYQ